MLCFPRVRRHNTTHTLMKIYLLVLVLSVAVFAAGCGGSSNSSGSGSSNASLSSDDVAVVGSEPVTKATFADVMHQEQISLKSEGQTFPKPGTADYTTLQNEVLAVLVQDAEFDQQAQKLGVLPTQKDVQNELTQLKKQYFGGSEAKYQASLKKQGYTDAEVQQQIKIQLTSQALFNKVTASVQPTSAEISKYYQQHMSDYVVEQRPVEEILVGKNKQALANQIYNQVLKGASFAALAKKYSQDPGSKDKGGKFTAKKGSDVANFDAAVFAPTAKTGVLLKPVNTPEYGWFVIKPLANISTSTTTMKQAQPTISAQLKQSDANTAMDKWVNSLARGYCTNKQITYQAGYKPNPDPCAALTTSTPTTT
jgi:parvulin-like peptidyl-prolyl isomerase